MLSVFGALVLISSTIFPNAQNVVHWESTRLAPTRFSEPRHEKAQGQTLGSSVLWASPEIRAKARPPAHLTWLL